MASTKDSPRLGFRKGIEPVLDHIMVACFFLALAASVIHVAAQRTQYAASLDPLFTYLIPIETLILGAILLQRHRLSVTVKVVSIGLLLWPLILLSLMRSGLVGVGVLLICTFIVFSYVFVPLGRGLLITVLSSLPVFALTIAVARGALQFGPEVTLRHNSPIQWLLIGLTLVLFATISSSVIHALRTRLSSEIAALQESKEGLEELNEELEKNRQQMSELAYTDSLTGLPNRLHFERHVKERIASGVPSALLVLMDIRSFRVVNSLYGQAKGDEILKTLGKLIQGDLTEHQFAARMGGDEFAIWVEDRRESHIGTAFSNFMSKAQELLPAERLGHRLEYFHAVAEYSNNGTSYEECYENAGIALRKAKESPQLNMAMFTEAMRAEAIRRHHMLRLLEQAVYNREFSAEYQTKINLNTGAVAGVEALARWSTPQYGQVSPDEFIPLVMQSWLMGAFSKVIFETVLSQVPSLQRSYGEHISVALNISPAFFLSAGFTDYVAEILTQYSVDPHNITLEITEDIFVEDISRIQEVIHTLRVQGVSISLDDFGKGYSSLHYISHIELNELKVDRSFTEKICTDARSFGLMKIICSMADTFSFKVVAEGVETIEQAERLCEAGCDTAQGFLYSRPEAASA
ncbi:MAG: bifunctional diguanylate cyclase/phosphodiesterase [Spirochaetaceae bacterium]|nr:MAG: bifunctional diguanylate cyclase/phosphodiesterase [Spirochaetaceae bacterium]